MFPAQFIYDNTVMQTNVFASAYKSGVKKLLFPGSACTYPKWAPQPVKEGEFMNGPVEPTNIAYAAAKINGIIMAQSFAREYKMNIIIPMLTNTYGVGDNFSPESSHVIPALMKRFHEARAGNLPEVVLWGSGNPLREFIYVDDAADAFIFLMQKYDSYDTVNAGSMQEISVKSLAELIAKVVGYSGNITLDASKPDGAPRKILDSGKLFALGWKPKVSLEEGLRQMYKKHFG
jgi:GDP-L-fucose synthase